MVAMNSRDDDSTEIRVKGDEWRRALEAIASEVVSATTFVGMVGVVRPARACVLRLPLKCWWLQMKAGKSSTISGLVGHDICPSRSTAMTVCGARVRAVRAALKACLAVLHR